MYFHALLNLVSEWDLHHSVTPGKNTYILLRNICVETGVDLQPPDLESSAYTIRYCMRYECHHSTHTRI